jgi:hypothetical protein
VAAELARLPRARAERELRDTFGKALRVTALGRQIQGVYAIHWHGGDCRPAHPHIHALFSPRRRDGCGLYLSRSDVGVLWGAWSRNVDRTLLVRRPPPLLGSTPGGVGELQIRAWVMGTSIAQAIRPSLLRYQQAPHPSAEALRHLLLGARHLPTMTGTAEFARQPLRTLIHLAALTALRPVPRPLFVVTRAIQGLSRERGPEL